MQTVDIPISELKAYDKNAKIHDAKQNEQIANSLLRFGWKQPLVVDKDNVIIVGHGRLEGAKIASKTDKRFLTAPCIIADDLTEEEIKAYRLADNKLNESPWDFDLLGEELQDITEIDMSDFGFDMSAFEEELAEVVEDDFEAELPEEPKSKLGDIYQLGRHRLICGDSTDPAVIDRLMGGVKADMVFTDPPYGMKKESEGVLNDNLNFDDLLDFNRQWIPLTFGALKDNGSWYCWGIDEPLMDIYSNILKPMARENKITFRNLITWDKGSGQGQLSSEFRMYPIADEKCLFVQAGIQCLTLNADQYWEKYEPIRKYLYDERIKCGWDIPTMKTIAGHSDKSRDHWTSKSQWNLPTEDVYIKFQNWAKEHNIKAFTKQYEELRKQYEELRAYFDNTHDNMNDVWHFSKTSGEERESAGGHATPKPIALCSRAIKSSSRDGEIVLDVFGGSGSTLIACEQLNRKCYMCELDPRYVDVIIDRWEKFTGQKAVKLN